MRGDETGSAGCDDGAAVDGGGGGRLLRPDADEAEETGDTGAVPSGQDDDLE